MVSCQWSVVSGKNQDFQRNHWQFLVVSYFRHPALGEEGKREEVRGKRENFLSFDF
ncbi:hypothetical protein [Argonema antarcticum]|uniref:hypothetical protein n=1 Tax=Argonema antarcticum TaxID=2942763 RepID=UPI002010D566|nr:hypothetical protein [Argonema antarcticum]MCL1470408.1 hypothetical protein [Argonema antarcticum A004/B2]